MAEHLSRFREFKPLIEKLELMDDYKRSQLLTARFRISQIRDFDIYYAPFDYINTDAPVTLVGVTPGWTQMNRSFVVARDQIEKGSNDQQILREAKRVASFSGTLRTNLVSMLDGIGLPAALNIPSSSVLFEPEGEDLLHSTSAIRYPVFKNGQNYSGRNPLISKAPFFGEYSQRLVGELEAVPKALIVPLGKSVEGTLSQLVDANRIDGSRIMFGFPHPSGASPSRPRLYAESQEEMSKTVERWAGSR